MLIVGLPSGVGIVFYVHGPKEIDFDFDLDEIRDEGSLESLCEAVRRIGQTVRKDVKFRHQGAGGVRGHRLLRLQMQPGEGRRRAEFEGVQIRPQRATVVTPISEEAIRQAKFIRLSLELSCIREAVQRLTEAQLDALEGLLDRQQAAADADRRSEFHALDDQFHHDIASHSGLGFVWAVVKDKKGHMDRARYLSLGYNAGTALAEHRVILHALRARDSAAALAAMTAHLSRIDQLLARLRSERPEVLGA